MKNKNFETCKLYNLNHFAGNKLLAIDGWWSTTIAEELKES